MQYLETSDNLLLLSDESRRIEERPSKRELISSLSLDKGKAGLHENIPQAEGLLC
ncbi:SdiA-regulated domain-containing protein [Malonomonas rubra]|uniref:SdiA-regulated domain-containing protein n=1 Tax=Malonomonas rubra TaxID=57040 RepID=UPI0009FFEB5E